MPLFRLINVSRFNLRRLSAPELGIAIGAFIGLIDSLINGSWRLDPLSIVWLWTTICCACGVIFSAERLGKLRNIAMAFAGPGLLIGSRAAIPLKEKTAWSAPIVVMVCVLATIVIAIPLSFVPLVRTRHTLAFAFAVLLSIGGIVCLAADVRAADWISRESTPTPNAHNVVLIFLDTLRADEAFDGPSPAMPNLARFASNAAWFDNAWAPAPWTVPSHFAVLTGANWWRVPPSRVGLEYSGPRLAEEFRRHGYKTAAIFANPILRTDPGFTRGFDEFTVSRGPGVCRSGIGEALYLATLFNGPRAPLCVPFTGAQITSRALQFSRRTRQPYFLAINYFDAHDPYYAPGIAKMSVEEWRAWRRAVIAMRSPGNAVINRTHAQYHAAMSALDRSLNPLLETLGRDPNTVIAIVGDHGEEFFEHGRGEHGYALYRESLRVPLILRAPGIPAQRVTAPVSTTDLYLSLLRATGFARAEAPLPLLDPAQRRKVTSTYELIRGPYDRTPERAFSIVSGDFHFIYWRGGREALFNYRTDPEEKTPLPALTMRGVADPMRQSMIRALRDKQRALPFSAVGYMR